MDAKQLAALTAVAEQGGFTPAARALGTVQSNISGRIARLEDELGTVLVDRGLGTLTPEGEVVNARAKRVANELAAIKEDVASMTSEVTGRVRLGIIGTPGRWLLPEVLDELERSYSAVDVLVTEATSTALVGMLVSGAIDLAVLNLPVEDDDVVTAPLWNEQLVVITPSDHPLAAKGDRKVKLAELASHELLMGQPTSILRRLIDGVAAKAGIELKSLAQLDGMRLTATLAFQGYGPAVVPITSIPEWAPRGKWNVLNVDEFPLRRVGLATRRRGMQSSALSAARGVVRASVARLIPKVDGVEAP